MRQGLFHRIAGICRFFAVALALSAVPLAADAAELETPARSAMVLDFDTGEILFAKNLDMRIEPASMTKMMTIYMLFERLHSGALSLDDTFMVSENAWRKGGSKMWVEVGKQVKVEDLIHGIIVQSGNDATIVVAEGLSGTEESFAAEMTRKARALGMTNTTFRNASGWPDPEHLTTVHDLARLAEATIRNFPDLYHYYSEKTFTYSGITQPNRNPLLYSVPGTDGLKTGHTESAGFGLTASAKRDGRRLILVAAGMDSDKTRASETARIMEWAFREFETYPLFKGGETVADASVWLGRDATVPLTVEKDMRLTMKRTARQGMQVKAVYETPVPAPIKRGTPVGRLVVSGPEMKPVEVPLLAGADVPALGLFGRLWAALHYLVFGASVAQ
ncbi:MAG: D-alanyl-D-alanine carboxypeptidase family protein [Alphaproteobacteria bacterium]